MKVSVNTLKYHSNVNPAPNGIDDLIHKIGAQLGEIEDVSYTGSKYDGIVVARVVSCEKHPNADKLSVCLIDDGGVVNDVERTSDGLVQVVCGAPNVRGDLIVAWIPPGATVPTTVDTDPFVLEAKELRGVVSNGMLASANELGISDDHSGLLEIKSSDVGEALTRPGAAFKELYGLDDVIVEIENKMFTHRPDCFGILGIARELAGIYGQQFSSPDWYKEVPEFDNISELPLHLENRLPELVPRFSAVALANVSIGPSPIWLQALLTRIGIKPINNIVDITNYIAYLTGQPMHAYDYDKVANLSEGEATLVVRTAESGEQLALLNGKTIEPRSEAIMIATDKELIGIGGVMGGTSTEVDQSTTRVILECANFDMYSIRRTSMAHGLFTEAVTRFTKGQSPYQISRVMAKAMELANELSGATQASKVLDQTSSELATNVDNPNITVNTEIPFINQRLGTSLTSDEIAATLKNVEFNVDISDQNLAISVPFWRSDIYIPEDAVEEIIRLRGYDTLPFEMPRKTIAPAQIETGILAKDYIRKALAASGANEVLTYSFVHKNLLSKAGQDPELAFTLSNAISPELQCYRLSLTPNLLQLIHPNIKAGYQKFALFELGKVHAKSEIDDDSIPREFPRASLVLAGISDSNQPAAFFEARAYLDGLELGLRYVPVIEAIDKYADHTLFQQLLAPYEATRSAYVYRGDDLIGVVGEFTLSVIKAFKLPLYCAGFEIFASQFGTRNTENYRALSPYPNVWQDVCFETDSSLSYADLFQAVETAISEVVIEDESGVELRDIFAGENLAGKKRTTFRFYIWNLNRTLNDSHVSGLIDLIAKKVSEALTIRRV